MSPALDSREAVYKGIETIYTYLLAAFNKMNEGSDDKKLADAVEKAESRVEEMMDKFGEDGVELSDSEWGEIKRRLVEEFSKKAMDDSRDDLADAMSEIADLHKKLTGEEEDEARHLAEDLIKEIEELEESDYEETTLDKSMVLSSHTKITWVKAKMDERASNIYKEAKGRVKREISKLKKKIQLYGNMEKYTIRNQKQGRIDKRMLHRIPSGRLDLFKTTIIKEDKPLDICLLVDESGSMGGYTMGYARDAAISLKEALSENERLNLWVYGHSADEGHRGDTEMIEYWSPSMKDRPMAMGGMKARFENRDGNAILASAERVRRESDQPQARKLLIVLSDGAPSAQAYRGYQAVDHVRKCVKSIESRGWDVIQVGFAGSREGTMERMFSNYVYVSETKRLGDKVSKIIRRVLKI
jgi:nitric oxide reductase activation protein